MGVEELAGVAAHEVSLPDNARMGEGDAGRITLNNEVVALITTIELVKIEGVVTLSGRSSYSDFEGARSKDAEKGVAVKINDNHCTVGVEVNIRYGANVYDTARKLQRNIKSAIENYTGLIVDKVDVTIRGMIIDAPPAGTKSRSA